MTKSDNRGLFSFEDLPVGVSDLKVEKQGFKTYEKSGIILDVNAVIAANATLQVGESTKEVIVTSNNTQVETTSTQLGAVIDGEKITTVPLNGRSYLDLLALQPGSRRCHPE